MDFKKLCKLYIVNKDRMINKVLVHKAFYLSYELLKYKKNKLKIGELKFAFKQLYYDEYLISSWFELVSAAQDPNTFEKKVKATLKMLDWAWDWSTIFLLGIIIGTLINYYGSRLTSFYNIYIIGDYSQEVLKAGLKQVFKLTDFKLLDATIWDSNRTILQEAIIDLILYLNLF